LCTPRTGSRSFVEALKKSFPGAVESEAHHVHPEEVSREIERLGGDPLSTPKFALIRNPYHQTLSWFGHVVLRHDASKATEQDFKDFIKTCSVNFFFNERLSIYADVPNINLIPFKRKNLNGSWQKLISLSNTLNGTSDRVTPLSRIGGGSTPPKELITADTKYLIDQRFPEDIKLWQRISKKA